MSADGPEWDDYVDHVLNDLIPKIADSAVTLSLVPKGATDVKFAIELGLSVMMDKPIVLLVEPGTAVPAKLVRVADDIIEFTGDHNDLVARLAAVMRRLEQ